MPITPRSSAVSLAAYVKSEEAVATPPLQSPQELGKKSVLEQVRADWESADAYERDIFKLVFDKKDKPRNHGEIFRRLKEYLEGWGLLIERKTLILDYKKLAPMIVRLARYENMFAFLTESQISLAAKQALSALRVKASFTPEKKHEGNRLYEVLYLKTVEEEIAREKREAKEEEQRAKRAEHEL